MTDTQVMQRLVNMDQSLKKIANVLEAMNKNIVAGVDALQKLNEDVDLDKLKADVEKLQQIKKDAEVEIPVFKEGQHVIYQNSGRAMNVEGLTVPSNTWVEIPWQEGHGPA